ncbi:MAG: carbohydrate ABC transporter permease [Ardenticatenaceae bacterium]
MGRSKSFSKYITYGAVYILLSVVAFFMLFPFLFMFMTSFKEAKDVFNYPPRLLPYAKEVIEVDGESLPLYSIEVDGVPREFVLMESGIKVGVYAEPSNLEVEVERSTKEVRPTGGFMNTQKVTIDGEEQTLYDIELDGEVIPMILVRQTTIGRFVDRQNPEIEVLQNVRLSQPVEQVAFRPQNYQDVLELQRLDRSFTNTILVTLLVVVGQVVTSVLGGYAFARLRFPGRDQIFIFYLGTIMIPFVVLIIPMYQLMVAIGWVDRLASLIVPWIFTAYGTFLMRQFFLSIPKELEEAALIDGASRLTILWRIIVPISMPAIATQATFTFLYAWNSFIWPLIIINTGNTDNHVLTLALMVLKGRAAESPNLVMAGAAIAVLPPMLIFIFAQRYFVEGVASSGLKG